MIGTEDNEEFEVDKIVAQRINSEGIIEYKIRWKGFSSESDTWEPEINLIGCEEVLREFKLNNEVIKKDFEDGEVSETDSSPSDSNDVIHRRVKKTPKIKKRKSKKRSNSKLKSETQQPQDIQTFNEDFGIKIEIGIKTSSNPTESNQSSSNLTSNFSMGASELLLNYYPYPSMTPSITIDSHSSSNDCKQELIDLTEDNVVIKEEKSSLFDFASQLSPPQHRRHQSESEQLSDEADSNSDSDLDGQLKVVINDEQDINNQMESGNKIDESIANQSEKARSWREQLDSVNFKIRKSQRKDDPGATDCVSGSISMLAKDKWTVKLKDVQTEAFYNLPVVQSVQESRLRVDQEIGSIRNQARIRGRSSREEIVKAIEDGNSAFVWKQLLDGSDCGGTAGAGDWSLSDGDLLVLAAKCGFSDIVGMIIRAGADVNYQNEDGITPLMTACEYGHEIVCNLLILNGAHINFVNKKFESAVLKVVSRGHKECLSVLLQCGCDVFCLDNEKGPLITARQRNLHEMEALITDYHKKLSDRLTQHMISLMGSLLTVSYVLFPLRIVSLYEEKDFLLEFNAKIPPVKEDECNLLVIFTGIVEDKQIQFCFEQVTAIKSVILNDIEQQSLVPDESNYVMSMAPVLDGRNVLSVKFESTIDSRWIRSLIIGFRVKINPIKAS